MSIAVSKFLAIGLLVVALHARTACGAEPAQVLTAPSNDAPARSRQDAQRIIEAHGFSGAHGFSLDDAGAWRASAQKYDRRWRVNVDARGNFDSEPAGARGDLRVPAQTDGGDEAPAQRPRAKVRLFLVVR